MFYDYRQNNSGGGFDIDERRGISVNVIIEADSSEEANERAERIGLYFDGIEYNDEGENIGSDCDCCGERWSSFWGEPSEVPSIYGKPLIEVGTDPSKVMTPINWAGNDPDVFVHLKDGRKFGFHLIDGRYVYKGDPADLVDALPGPAPKAIG